MQRVTVDPRFAGPPGCGNGGYVCGMLAGLLGGTVQVTLRRAVPLGRPLSLLRPEPGLVRLVDGDALLAEARPADLALDLPEPPTVAAARAAIARSPALAPGRLFPACFVCGPERAAGEGLRLFPGPVAGSDLLAAAWVPEAGFADEGGIVRPEFAWAALDCPGGFAVLQEREGATVLLGRLTGRIERPIRAGRPHVVAGWRIGSDGRKHEAGTAVFAEDGSLYAAARATWIEVAG